MVAQLVVDRACPVCSSRRVRHPRRPDLPIECRDCGHGDSSHAVRSGEVVNQDPDRDPPSRPGLLHRDQLRIIAPLLRRGGPLIDIGCSSGTLLRHALDHIGAPASSYGTEISEPNRRAAARAGVRVEQELAEVGAGAVVTMWHSAEHFPLPTLRTLLSDLRSRSDDDVRLVVSVPNGASLQWKLFRSRWTYFDPGAHFSQFTPRSLDHLVGECGWRRSASPRTPVYGAFGAIQSSINLLRPHNELYLALKRGEGRVPPSRLALSLGAAVLTSPVALAASTTELVGRRASVVTAVFAPA